MKKTVSVLLACLLTAALLVSAFAKNGPYTPEDPEGWQYAFLRLIILDENEKGQTVINEYGDEQEKFLPLYERGKVTEQEGAVYAPATNTLTLTDFNKGNYKLHVNLMGDDFTLCVKGACTLSRIEVTGGGVMQPKWGDNLRITGDGSLTVNPNKTFESGIYFAPQEEENTVLDIGPDVNLTVSGSRTAIEVFAGFGNFTVKKGDQTIEMNKKDAVRNLSVSLDGYSNRTDANLRLCRNAADPDGVYHMSEWFDANDNLVNVSVEKYVYLAKYDLYVEDHDWAKNQGSETADVLFANLQEANDAGFTYILNEAGESIWRNVNTLANWGSIDIYEDAAGNRYGVTDGYDDQREYRKIALTFEPIAELPGMYAFFYTSTVDPDTLTEVREDRVIENMFDYNFPETELKIEAAPAFKRGDVDGDGSVTASDARYALRAAVGLNDTAEGLDFSDSSNRCYLAADVDGITGISAGDARLILRAAVGLEDLEG